MANNSDLDLSGWSYAFLRCSDFFQLYQKSSAYHSVEHSLGKGIAPKMLRRIPAFKGHGLLSVIYVNSKGFSHAK